MLCDGKEGRPLIYAWKQNSNGKWYETDRPLYIEQYVYWWIKDWVHTEINSNGDGYILIDGEEGSGKSQFATQIAALITWIASNHHKVRRKLPHDQKNYCWRVEDFLSACKTLPNWSVVVLDESRTAAGSAMTNSRTVKKLTNFASEQRGPYHKFCIMILPKIHELTSYFSKHRGQMLFSFYKKEYVKPKSGALALAPGHFRYFGKKKLELIGRNIDKGKKTDYYPYTRYNNLRAVNACGVDKGKIDAKKKAMIEEETKGVLSAKEIREKARAELIVKISQITGSIDINLADLWECLGTSKYEWYKALGSEWVLNRTEDGVNGR